MSKPHTHTADVSWVRQWVSPTHTADVLKEKMSESHMHSRHVLGETVRVCIEVWNVT